MRHMNHKRFSTSATLLACLSTCLVFCSPSRPALAQRPTGVAVVDSANAARAAWARAAAALRRDDSATARTEVARAAEVWPTQSSYLWARAVLAARSHDSLTTFDALRRYASLGLGRDLRVEREFTWLRQSPTFESIIALHDSNFVPRARSHIVATLPDSTFWPEGMDVDARTGSFYIASVVHRTIAEVRRDGT